MILAQVDSSQHGRVDLVINSIPEKPNRRVPLKLVGTCPRVLTLLIKLILKPICFIASKTAGASGRTVRS